MHFYNRNVDTIKMRLLIVYLVYSFVVTLITAQECSPCKYVHIRDHILTVDCTNHGIGWNNLTEIPDTISRNTNELYFVGQSFTSLKENTFTTFNKLTMINFGFNKIEILDKLAFKNLHGLTDLWLSHNKIQTLPDGIFRDLREIQRIDLSDNDIVELPKDIFSNLSNLINLWLYRNKLKVLPDGIFRDLRQIDGIAFGENSITELQQNLFSNLSTLTHLSIFSLKIKTLPDGIFDDIRQVQEIYLNNNYLTGLQKKLFHNLPRLFNIDISNNKINTIQEGSFSRLPNLEKVRLENNELNKLKIDIIDNAQQLKYFDLSANPWHCDEDLCAVMDSASSSVFHSPTCRTPEEIKDKTWTRLLDVFIPSISNKTLKRVEAGDAVYLQCKYCFASKIIWKFNNKYISRDHNVDISAISLTSTLILYDVTEDDSGYYSCHVENCATCETAGTYLNIEYRTADDEKYADPVPTASSEAPSTSTDDQEDENTNSYLYIYLIIAVSVLIILIAFGISMSFRRNHRKEKTQ